MCGNLDNMDKILRPQAQFNWATELQRIVEEYGRDVGVPINSIDATRIPAPGEVIWMYDVSFIGNSGILRLYRLEGGSHKPTDIKLSQADEIPYSSIRKKISDVINSRDV